MMQNLYQKLMIHSDPSGVLWFGTGHLFSGGREISRYDGKDFINFTTADGLASNTVMAIHSDSDGVMWFGTQGGVSRYDGKEFRNLTTKDGLPSSQILGIHSDSKGALWFATWNGLSRYDGDKFDNYQYNGAVQNYYNRYMGGEKIPAGWVNTSDYDVDLLNE